MKLGEVPQDQEGSKYGGHQKLLYAVDEQGHYQEAQSVGWDAENYATDLALQELAQQARQAHANWQAGHASVLPYLMYRYRMDELALAQCTGLWRWRIRRHFRQNVFARLSVKVLARYAQAFSLPLEQLSAYQQGYRDDL